MLQSAGAWLEAVKRELLPVPNPYAQTNIIYTSKGRQAIYSKLDRIILDKVTYDGLPLGEVSKALSAEVERREPEKQGVNFMANTNVGRASAAVAPVEPATGLPAAGGGEPG